jgi:hypothetical protein
MVAPVSPRMEGPPARLERDDGHASSHEVVDTLEATAGAGGPLKRKGAPAVTLEEGISPAQPDPKVRRRAVSPDESRGEGAPALGGIDAFIKDAIDDIRGEALLALFPREMRAFVPPDATFADFAEYLRQPQGAWLRGEIDNHGQALNGPHPPVFSSLGDVMVTAHRYADIKVWDVGGSRAVSRGVLTGTRGDSSAVFSPDDAHIIASGGDTHELKVFDAKTLEGRGSLRDAGSSASFIDATTLAAFHHAKRELNIVVLTSEDGSLALARTVHLPRGTHPEGDLFGIRHALSPDGKYLAAAAGTQLSLWKVADLTGASKQIEPLVSCGDAHAGRIGALAFSADGKTMASMDEQNFVHVWQVPAGEGTALKHLSTLRPPLGDPAGNVSPGLQFGGNRVLATVTSPGAFTIYQDPGTEPQRVADVQAHGPLLLSGGRFCAALLGPHVGKDLAIWHVDRQGAHPSLTRLSTVAGIATASHLVASPDGRMLMASDAYWPGLGMFRLLRSALAQYHPADIASKRRERSLRFSD